MPALRLRRPADHVAIHRYWHEQHVAKLVALQSDTVEMMVEKPPRTRKAAMQRHQAKAPA